MKQLPQVKMKVGQEYEVYKKIRDYFDDLIFNYIDEVLSYNPVQNSKGIASAISVGKITYKDGVFKPKGKLSNKLAKELESLGAKYSKSAEGYRLGPKKFTPEISQAVSQINIANQNKIKLINKYLDGLEETKDYAQDNVSFDLEVKKIGEDLDAQFKRSMKTINVIPPNLTSYQLAEIAKNYTYNLNYYIKKWTQEEIIKLRKDMNKFVIQGYRAEALEDMIEKQKNVSRNKAKFLARQETKLLVAEYRKNRFKEQGVTRYRWSTILDGRERELHKKLNGRIFSWSEPPIIDDVTGERGNPGEAYNCYSKDTEVLTAGGFKLIKDVKVGEKIASLNPKTKQWEWTICTNKVAKKVSDIVNIHSGLFDLAVSPDHTFFYYKKTEKKRIEYPVFTKGIESLSRKNTSFYATSDNWQGIDVESVYGMPAEVFCKFMGFYLSDGCVDKRSNKCIHIAQQNNDWMYDELKNHLHVCKGKEKLYIYNEDLYKLVAPLGFCNEKRIPDIIKNMSPDKIRVFLDAYAKCDGISGKNVKGWGKDSVRSYNQYFTTSPKMMADLVECIYKTNMSASVYTRNDKGKQNKFKNGVYTQNYDLYIIQELKTKNRTMENAKIEINRYDDYVYDIEVMDNHTILIKSGKSIHWNSNCRCSAIPIVDEDFYKH